jgi:hypothetical protein
MARDIRCRDLRSKYNILNQRIGWELGAVVRGCHVTLELYETAIGLQKKG